MSSPSFLVLVLLAFSGLYFIVIASIVRASRKRLFSAPWLLLPLCGATIIGLALALSIPAAPDSSQFMRFLALLAHLFNILLIWLITSRIAPARRLPGTLLYAWNPLVLIELAVYGNSAGIVITLLLLAVVLMLEGVQFESYRRDGDGGDGEDRRRPQGSPPFIHSAPASTMNGPEESPRSHSRGGGRAKVGGGPLRSPSRLRSISRPYDIATLILVGLALRINLMTLLIAPLLLWFMVRHGRSITAALRGFVWRALVVLAVFVVAYVPAWHGISTFLAITDTIHLFDFANSPLSLLVLPARSLFKFVAQNGHFPPSLMQPGTAADMTVIATSIFLFALLYVREMGRVRARLQNNFSSRPVGTRGGRGEGWGPYACPAGNRIRTGPYDSQWDADKGTERGMPEESQLDEDKHKAPSSTLHHPLSLQDDAEDAGQSCFYDALFTGLAVVVVGYIVLAVTIFLPGYIVWGVWVVALRRFDALSICLLLLSCSALLYYPLQELAPTATAIVLPVCVFGVPLVYLLGQRFMPRGKSERKNVLS